MDLKTGIFIAIIYFDGACIAISLIVGIALFLQRRNTHRKRRDEYIMVINAVKSKKMRFTYTILSNRSYDYICNFFIQQIIAKATSSLALLFTISSFTLSCLNPRKSIYFDVSSTVIALLSIIFVITNIYVNPLKKAIQYLGGWRETDRLLLQLTTKVHESKKSQKKFAKKCSKIIGFGEYKITSDEE